MVLEAVVGMKHQELARTTEQKLFHIADTSFVVSVLFIEVFSHPNIFSINRYVYVCGPKLLLTYFSDRLTFSYFRGWTFRRINSPALPLLSP